MLKHTRCPPIYRSWRRAKIVGHLCEVHPFAPLCLVHFPEIRGFATCTYIARALHNAPQQSKSCTIEEHSLNCISVSNFASLPESFPNVKVLMHVHDARTMHVHYAPHHQMQCAIEVRTLNSISVPNLVSLAQSFLELEDPPRIKFSVLARAACIPQEWQPEKYTDWGSIHVICKSGTGGVLRLACRVGKRTNGTKHLHVYCTCTLHSSPLNCTAPSAPCQGLLTHRVCCR